MGLDMYLERINRKMIPFKDVDLESVKEKTPKIFEEMSIYAVRRGENFPWYSLFEEVGYWRKANHIHRWFVDNVQDGEDDCMRHQEVTKEKLLELRDTCKKVLAARSDDVAESLLPRAKGFFFGTYAYDEEYYDDIKRTVEVISDVLEETDFETQALFYCSSW